MAYRLIFTDIRYLHSADIRYFISVSPKPISDIRYFTTTDIRYFTTTDIRYFTDIPNVKFNILVTNIPTLKRRIIWNLTLAGSCPCSVSYGLYALCTNLHANSKVPVLRVIFCGEFGVIKVQTDDWKTKNKPTLIFQRVFFEPTCAYCTVGSYAPLCVCPSVCPSVCLSGLYQSD